MTLTDLIETPWHSKVNRSANNVLDEIRTSVETIWSPVKRRHLSSLVEELQTYLNRMEAHIEDWNDIQEGRYALIEMRDEYEALEEAIEVVKGELGELLEEKTNNDLHKEIL